MNGWAAQQHKTCRRSHRNGDAPVRMAKSLDSVVPTFICIAHGLFRSFKVYTSYRK
jgi:hypothetical protein